MQTTKRALGIAGLLLLAVSGLSQAAASEDAQRLDATSSYPKMAPVDQYLMPDRDAEIAMARSAAPESISRDVEVVVSDRRR